MRAGLKLLIAITAFFPFAAYAGSAYYGSPGSYGFTVPAYSSLTVYAYGAGGGGGGGMQYATVRAGAVCNQGGSGGDGGASSFDSVVGYGGGGGQPVSCWSWSGGESGGQGGASGGDSNVTGGGAQGGCGGTTVWNSGWNGGAGGNGGLSVRTYYQNDLTSGSSLGVSVGSGGSGGSSYAQSGGTGSDGSVYITWSDPPPASCSVWFDQNPIAYGGATVLRWSSSNADSWLYINNVGYVGGSGATWVSPSSSTDYSCVAYGSGGTDGWHGATLYVNAPLSCSLPWGGSITHGQSVTAYQSSSVPYGNSCVSQTRSCDNGSLSGSYTYASCSVAAAPCTQGGTTVQSGSSYTFYSTQTAPSGELCSSATYSQSRTCTNGTLSGSSSYQYSSCSCTPSYSCSSNTVQYTNSACATTNVTSCQAPAFCSPGSSSCLLPAPSFTSFNGTYSGGSFSGTGHLQILPTLVPQNTSTKLFWNLANVSSCTVQGENGDHWTGASSGSSGVTSALLTQQTSFTLSCTGDDSSHIQETGTVYIVPVFQER